MSNTHVYLELTTPVNVSSIRTAISLNYPQPNNNVRDGKVHRSTTSTIISALFFVIARAAMVQDWTEASLLERRRVDFVLEIRTLLLDFPPAFFEPRSPTMGNRRKSNGRHGLGLYLTLSRQDRKATPESPYTWHESLDQAFSLGPRSRGDDLEPGVGLLSGRTQ